MSSKVWLVTSGEYSDYGVTGAFSTEEDANAAIALGYGGSSYDAARVEEYVLHGPGEMPVKSVVWIVSQDLIGDRGLSVISSEDWDVDKSQLNKAEVNMWANQQNGRVHCRSFNRERAVKIVSDRIAKLRAEREGL